MNLPHDKFCVLPWISLETSPIGTVRPCCLAEEEIVDDNGEKFELSTADFSQIQNSIYMKNLRKQFLDKKQPSTCRKCWNEERAGRTSKRMHTIDRLKHMINDNEWSLEAKPLMFLDLKLGNICNLKCRICGSWSSSTFAVEELNFVSRDEQEKKKSYHYIMLKKGAWPKENQNYWEELESHLDDIRYIEFTGGEPFMIREHFRILERIIEKGNAGQVEIHYNTNGTQFPVEAEHIWKHFKTVEIAFSIDDVGERFEYQRSNADWKEVNDNIDLFFSLKQKYPNIRLQVCSTVNVFNVMYLESLAHWIDQRAFDFIYWNMLHEAYYLSIATLPEDAKEKISILLDAAEVSSYHKKEFAKIKDFMLRGVCLDGNILRMKVKDLDWRRKQDLRTHHCELAEVIDYHGPD